MCRAQKAQPTNKWITLTSLVVAGLLICFVLLILGISWVERGNMQGTRSTHQRRSGCIQSLSNIGVERIPFESQTAFGWLPLACLEGASFGRFHLSIPRTDALWCPLAGLDQELLHIQAVGHRRHPEEPLVGTCWNPTRGRSGRPSRYRQLGFSCDSWGDAQKSK